jgi:hypothetical protein
MLRARSIKHCGACCWNAVSIAAILLIALAASFTEGTPTPVPLLQHDSDFINAITDPTIELLQVPDTGFKFNTEVWVDQSPLILEKNLTIRGSRQYPTVNFMYINSKVQLRQGFVLKLEQITIVRSR